MADKDYLKKRIWEVSENPPWRPRKFKTPQELWDCAVRYFTWCEANPMIQKDYRGKDATEVSLPHPQPFTIKAFTIFAGVEENYLRGLRQQLNDENVVIDPEFSTVITRIEKICYTQKFSHAAAGFFKENIISRDLGLIDKQQHDVNDVSPPRELKVTIVESKQKPKKN